MAVVIETTIGDFTIDLYTEERPRTCLNFLKLCKQKYYNLNLMYSVERNFVAQMGDPTSSGKGGDSIFSAMFGEQARLFEGEKLPVMKHTDFGTVSMVAYGDKMYGSQFFVTLGENLDSLDDEHLVFGQVTEGLDVIAKLNDVLTDGKNRPYQDIRISHTVVLEDPYPDPEQLQFPDESPRPTPEMLASEYIAVDESVDDTKGKDIQQIHEEIAAKEAEARATILEMVGDLPEADMAPPENVLFVCKLNPVTTSEDLEVIFSRFGKIVCAEVIKDRITGNSLQYAFIEFDNKKSCEDAYFKMDNVLIDDRRIHVDFSQSVSKIQWKGKGRGVVLYDDHGKKIDKENNIRSKRADIVAINSKGNDSKSIFIDTEAYGKRFKERHDQGRNYRNDRRHIEEEKVGSGKRDKDRTSRNREDYDRRNRDNYRRDEDDDRRRHHSRERENRHSDRRNAEGDRYFDRQTRDVERNERYRPNQYTGERRDFRNNNAGNRDIRNNKPDNRGNRNNKADNRDFRYNKPDNRDNRNIKDDNPEFQNRNEKYLKEDTRHEQKEKKNDERHDSDDHEMLSPDSSKRQTLLNHLRTELKTKNQDSIDNSSNESDASVDVKKKKKKSKKQKSKKRRQETSDDSSDQDSDSSIQHKKKKAKKSKKKKKKSSRSSDSESAEEERRKEKKKSKKNKH